MINPDATAEEVAALVVVMSALQTPATPTRGNTSEWPVSNRLRMPVHARPGGWRTSSLPV
ncbi:MAG: acyl-CoA carboxylase subunit epsilon [Nocardioides sp.]|nr:acyl-CoA carboxylase subunit epsilon [Nocardioides sp.]